MGASYADAPAAINSTLRRGRIGHIPHGTIPKRIALVVVVVLYLAGFAWSYTSLIAPTWSYQGLVDRPANDQVLLLSYLVAWLPAWLLPVGAQRPSQVIVWLLYLWAYVPGVVMPYYVLSMDFAFLPITIGLAASFVILLLMQFIPRVQFRSPLAPSVSYPFLLALASFAAVAFVVATVGVTLELPTLDAVYDVRTEYLAELEDVGRVTAYAVGWAAYVFGPALIAVGLSQRRIAFAAAGVSIQVLIYGLTGLRAALLSTLLVGAISFVLAARRRHVAGLWLVAGSVFLLVTITAVDMLTGNAFFSSLFVRRLIAVPGWIFAHYADFFSTHPPYQLSHSVLAWLGERPYSLNPEELIAYLATGRYSGANGGIWADAMANFGPAGMLLFTLLLGILFWVMDCASQSRPLRIVGPMLAAASFSLVNSALFTSMLSHGIGLAVVLAWLAPTESSSEPNSTHPTDVGSGG